MDCITRASEYHYRIYFDNDTEKYVGNCFEFPHIISENNRSRTQAYTHIFNLICDMLDTLNYQEAKEIPKPLHKRLDT